MPKKDGVVRLPEHVTAMLLRALMSIRPRPESRLILRRVDEARPPGWDKATDYDVVFREQTVGRVWRHEYKNHTPDYMSHPWHWRINSLDGRPSVGGHAPTLEAAMADFRRAWDDATKSGVA